jgi:hypothetical protein
MVYNDVITNSGRMVKDVLRLVQKAIRVEKNKTGG